MAHRRRRRLLLRGRPRAPTLRLLARRRCPQRCDAGQPLVPVHRHRRHRHRLLRRQHAGARRRPRRDDATTPVDQSWALMRPRARLRRRRRGRGTPCIYQIFPDRFRNGRPKQRPADRRRPLRRPGPEADLGHEARGLLPQLRRRRDELPVALRHDAAGRQPDEGAAARPRLLRRRPRRASTSSSTTCQRSASTAIYFNPIFDAGSNHSLRHAGLQEGRPVLRHAEGLREPRQARRGARHPDHPRRRLQPHVVGQPALRPIPPLPDGRRLRVDDLAVSRLVRVHRRRAGTAPAPVPRGPDYDDLRGLVRLRLDPGPAQDASPRSRPTS